MFFLMSRDGKSRVYSHDWLRRSQAAHYVQAEAGRKVVKLILHTVGRELSGELECQIIMEVQRKESVFLVNAVRTHRVRVVERPEEGSGVVVRLVGEGEAIQCEAEGYPAPHLSWLSLEAGLVTAVSEDRVESLALQVESDSGLQVSRERMYRVEEGEFACLVTGMDGEKQVVASPLPLTSLPLSRYTQWP